ncbi:hypothetical protein FB451DRAFT_1564291 [Mycena latifolia]|nr:hypothetical protein FB451DRAFT_1564291 [Mycena latifolia]
MSSLDTLFTRLSRLRFSLCSPMTWPPNCFFDSPAYIGSLMCVLAAKKEHKLQKASKVPAMPSDHPLIAPGPDVPTPTAPPSDPPGDADCAEEQGACAGADSGSVGPPAPPCSPCTKALTLAHHLALLTVFSNWRVRFKYCGLAYVSLDSSVSGLSSLAFIVKRARFVVHLTGHLTKLPTPGSTRCASAVVLTRFRATQKAPVRSGAG